MARLPNPEREQLSPDSQRIWDVIAGSRGRVLGPYPMLLYVPPLAERVGALGEYLRFNGLLPGADRELAILTAARELRARYEWAAHEPFARREGTRPQAIETVRNLEPLEALTPHEQLLIGVVRSLYRDRALPNDLYERARVEFGPEQLVELVTLAGYYGMIAFVLNGFEVDLPVGAPPPF